MKCTKIQNWLQWMSMEGLENGEELVWKNRDFVHKSEVNPLPCLMFLSKMPCL